MEKTFKAAHSKEFKTTQIHLFPSCNSKIVTKGHGKQAKDILVRTCKTCGSNNVFCRTRPATVHDEPVIVNSGREEEDSEPPAGRQAEEGHRRQLLKLPAIDTA